MYQKLLVSAIIIRIFIPNDFLNLYYEYSSPGGNLIGKIHPGTYLILLLGTFNFFNAKRKLMTWERGPLIGCASLALCIGFVLATQIIFGRPGGSAYLIDTLLAAAFTTIGLLGQDADFRASASSLVIKLLLLNSVLVIGEFAFKAHLVPSPDAREFRRIFRPMGLFNHPLNVGLLNLTAIPFVLMTRWSFPARVLSVALLVTAVLACNARLATLLLAPVVLATTAFATARAMRAGHNVAGRALVISVLGATLIPFGIWASWNIGFFARLERMGLYDHSASSRVEVWRILNYLTPDQLSHGLPADILHDLLPVLTGYEILESSFLSFILQFGYLSAGLVVLGIFTFILSLIWRAPSLAVLGTLAFTVASFGTIVISTKSMCLTMLAVLLMGARMSGSHVHARTLRYSRLFSPNTAFPDATPAAAILRHRLVRTGAARFPSGCSET